MQFEALLEELKVQSLYRELRALEPLSAVSARYRGRTVLLFCSNDYLGLSRHPLVLAAAAQALQKYGSGAGASRLISGTTALTAALEDSLAEFKRTEAALVFSSGYLANLAAVAALAGPETPVLADKYIHASLIDACRGAGRGLQRFAHNHTGALARRLQAAAGKPALILIEGVYSMDGDLAPVPEILRLARKHEAMLLLDDAHGLGVVGESGRGSLEFFASAAASGEVDLTRDEVIQVGTLSKALGNLGGFIAGSKALKSWLINKARPFIYTTALPPAVTAGSLAALEVLRTEPEIQAGLCANIKFMRQGLAAAGFKLPDSPAAIIPIIVGASGTALSFSAKLLERGVFIPAIRPPTVPQGTARLRLTVSAAHTRAQLEQGLAIIEKTGRELQVIE